ncbi:MAG: hypothetical protein JST48_08605 [Bacteroidetes bacterium]|nr:hypothetical protein [Bacteroidota bacterium]
MAKLMISSVVGDGALWLYLDNALIGKNTESIALDIDTDQEYVVHWFVQGKPGSTYSITISSPKEAELQLTRGLRNSGKGFGGFKFKA